MKLSHREDVLLLTSEPINIVRVGFVGLGVRAVRAINRFLHLDGVEIKAICDLESDSIDNIQDLLLKNNRSKAVSYSGLNGWMALCEDHNLDLVYICTDWVSHTPISVYAMEAGKHVAVEVPAAMTIDECWQLVDTAEHTRKHCMMLENCCYDSFELSTLNMAQKGLFGEIIHGEGAYIHDLRPILFSDNIVKGKEHWQNEFNKVHTGNPYPTHGLGPICQAMNIHRGDKMDYLVSMSSIERGMTAFSKERYMESSFDPNLNYTLGDMNTTLIRTHKGYTIMLQHNIANPRPYSRIHLLNGTEGFCQKYPSEHILINSEEREIPTEILLSQFEHPFITKLWKKGCKVSGIRAKDFLMDYRLIYCLRNGLPLDQDVYDAAEWSCIVELSEKSVLNKSIPVEIPDFTRGAWKKLEGLSFFE